MPDLDISIGGRVFQVACQSGEEPFLQAAAQMLDHEAQPLIAQMGRMPEVRMLLMAGLMLADKTAALEDEVRVLRSRVAEHSSGAVEASPSMTAKMDLTALAVLAEQAERLADQIDRRQGAGA